MVNPKSSLNDRCGALVLVYDHKGERIYHGVMFGSPGAVVGYGKSRIATVEEAAVVLIKSNVKRSRESRVLARRDFIMDCAALCAGGLVLPSWVPMQTLPPSAGPASSELIEDLVAANRVLASENVVDAYGHVSARHDRNPNRYLISRSLAPELVTAEDIMEFDLDSRPVDARGRAPLAERFIHGEIYKARPDVKAVVHNHSPALIAFGISNVPLRPVYHMSSFIAEGVPVFEIRNAGVPAPNMLIQTGELGRALGKILGSHPAALMRGHGAVVVGPSVPDTVSRAVYLQVNAQVQSQAQAMAPGGNITYLNAEEAAGGQIYARAWELWKRKALGK
jgi:ribulose-5-phosphate 4-epimerase/fuculose-1-phosphate aldolase